MGCRRTLLPILDGNCGHPCCNFYRNTDIQMDNQSDAGIERITILGERGKLENCLLKFWSQNINIINL
jgi:hypothetical protein